jgi:hypothetical protein
MTAIASRYLARRSSQAATIVAPATGTIVLAFRGKGELWCSPLKAWAEGSKPSRRFVLAAGWRFRAQNKAPERGPRMAQI